MEDVDLMASRQEMEMAWASGGRTGEMGDEEAVPYPPPSPQGVLRVCQKSSLILTMILDRLGFRSIQRFGLRSMLASIGCIFGFL